MKRCPLCQQTFEDTLKFCRSDGAVLESLDAVPTEILTSRHNASTEPHGAAQTKVLIESDSAQAPTVRITSDLIPETRYAKSAEVSIAYQVLGTGPIDLIYVPGWVSHLEYGWEEPSLARFYRKLASFSRLILFDKRGTGLSDQSTNLPTLEQRMDDVRAVMEAVGSEHAVIFGMSEGGNMAMLFAATYPERTIALITFGVFAKRVYDSEYPWAPTAEQRQKFYDAIENEWGGPLGVDDLAPTRAHDERFRHWWASYQRRSASPRAALALAKLNTQIDVRHVLPAIRVPTLVLHRTEDRDSNIEEGRYIAARIANAKFVELPLEAADAEDKGGYAKAQDESFYRRQREMMAKVVAASDVVVTTAAIPGKRSPVLVTADMVANMAPGSVIVDLAAERGGNCELTKADEVVTEHGVTIFGPTDLPSTVPYHASQMYARNVATFVSHLMKDKALALDTSDEITRETLVTRDGQVVHARISAPA